MSRIERRVSEVQKHTETAEHAGRGRPRPAGWPPANRSAAKGCPSCEGGPFFAPRRHSPQLLREFAVVASAFPGFLTPPDRTVADKTGRNGCMSF